MKAPEVEYADFKQVIKLHSPLRESSQAAPSAVHIAFRTPAPLRDYVGFEDPQEQQHKQRVRRARERKHVHDRALEGNPVADVWGQTAAKLIDLFLDYTATDDHRNAQPLLHDGKFGRQEVQRGYGLACIFFETVNDKIKGVPRRRLAAGTNLAHNVFLALDKTLFLYTSHVPKHDRSNSGKLLKNNAPRKVSGLPIDGRGHVIVPKPGYWAAPTSVGIGQDWHYAHDSTFRRWFADTKPHLGPVEVEVSRDTFFPTTLERALIDAANGNDHRAPGR
jgi:hypothetical protein